MLVNSNSDRERREHIKMKLRRKEITTTILALGDEADYKVFPPENGSVEHSKGPSKVEARIEKCRDP